MKKILFIISIIAIGAIIIFGYNTYLEKQAQTKLDQSNKRKIAEVTKHYDKTVMINKDAPLYERKEDTYQKRGTIYKNTIVNLDQIKITSATNYFYIPSLKSYILYSDVDKADKIENIAPLNNRYQQYIVFNENIKTKATTTFYDEEKKAFTLEQSFDFPIIIKTESAYGIKWNDKLYYIQKTDTEKTYTHSNTTLKSRSNIRTLTYHFIYDKKEDSCNQSICHPLEQFESHVKYIHDNQYLSLTLNEVELFLNNQIRLPEKSIALTIDDGYLINQKGIDMLEKYQVYATLFVVTGQPVNKDRKETAYLKLASHTDNMHTPNQCPGGLQGGGILCLPEETVLNDLKKSRDILNQTTYFAYPFFDVNERAEKLVKKAGFTLAFVGQTSTNGFATPQTIKYRVPRKTIFKDTSYEKFVSYLTE